MSTAKSLPVPAGTGAERHAVPATACNARCTVPSPPIATSAPHRRRPQHGRPPPPRPDRYAVSSSDRSAGGGQPFQQPGQQRAVPAPAGGRVGSTATGPPAGDRLRSRAAPYGRTTAGQAASDRPRHGGRLP